MKVLVCKACGGNDFVREDGFYVCRHCGCKYTSHEVNQAVVEPLLGLVLRIIAKYINGYDSDGNYRGISEAEYVEGNKYMDQIEAVDPGNWKMWFYKGILEEIRYPTLYQQDVVSSFYCFENSIQFADDLITCEQILPVIDRLKYHLIDIYIKNEGSLWSYHDYYPVFLKEFWSFYSRYDIARAYAKKTSDEWDSLMTIVEKRQLINAQRARKEKVKALEKDLISINRYKNRMIRYIAEKRLYPMREAYLQKKLNGCWFFETEKRADLKRILRDLKENAISAEDSANRVKTKAYFLMKKNVESPPARDIWEETFVRLVSEYVEKCYIQKDMPSQEDKEALNARLFPIGFGIDYYDLT
ncbi:TFIIB-type zinc finger domain-containing protein [Butyrivibrio sp. LC3010]|uniref:TFIIB-type zinc finger domain-containing protein n=1 Tax=Butyrivibrio sp. LC3010 TaxID=1280680 RepID=UPI000410F371|nr:TFIIB-type zinc finger domain-containing protein [Butyrivibrio sp. LC3010]